MFEFKYAPKLLKRYARNYLHMSPTKYSFVETDDVDNKYIFTLYNSRRTEVVSTEELDMYNDLF